MTKFKIEYEVIDENDNRTIETEYMELEDWTGRSEDGDGNEFGDVMTITAKDWANDYGYSAANKGWYKVTEVA